MFKIFSGLKAKIITISFIAVLLSSMIVGYYGYKNASDAHMQNIYSKNKKELDDTAEKVRDYFLKISGEMYFLKNLYALNRYLYFDEIGDKEGVKEWRNNLMRAIPSFMETKELFFKVSFIDENGMEKVSIRYDNKTKKAIASDEKRETDLSDSNCFKKSIGLKNEQIYVSPLTLNSDSGKISTPHIPLVQYASPVHDKKSVRGVIVLSIYVDELLRQIKPENWVENAEHNHEHTYMVDKGGYYLAHHDKTKLFGSDLGHGANIRMDIPGLFLRMTEKESDAFIDGDMLVSFKRVYPLPENRDEYWMVINTIDTHLVMESLEEFRYIFILITSAVLFIIFFVLYRFMSGLTSTIENATKNLKALALGQTDVEILEYNKTDEIGEIAASVNMLVENTKKSIKQANIIASGNYTQQVELLSDNDELGLALNHMTQTLLENDIQNAKQNWIKDGLNTLASSLSGDLDTDEISQRALNIVSKYLQAGRGVLYVLDNKSGKFVLRASYAFNKHDQIFNIYEFGEGTIGQAGLDKEPKLTKNPLKDEVNIPTGIVSIVPKNIYTMPLLYEDEVQGVMELALGHDFTDSNQSFMNEAAKLIATYIYTSKKKEEIKKLLQLSEEATKEAQKRSEELQITNAQMEEQQQQLQQQSEELQQANVQMEEQQQQLRLQTEELTLKNESLLLQQNELEKSSRYKTEFLANISHELRTPLSSVILLSRLLARNDEKSLNDSDIKKANIINRAGNELLRLINDILDISKIEAGKMLINISNVKTGDLTENMNDFFESTATEKNIEFIIKDNIKGEISTDKEKLFQVIRNFLSNSFKFTKEGSVSLIIQNRDDKEYPYAITVSDTGIGIPKYKQNEIFKAFSQVDGSITREFGGTGLGLAISLQFTELIGGKIELKSDEGKGSVFTVLLPEKPKETMDEDFIELKEPQNRDRLLIGNDKKQLLIVEDDLAFADVVSTVAKKRGYETIFAVTGKEGIEKAKEHSPDGIVLDRKLPDMNGIEILKEIKKTENLGRIPVYIISGTQKDSSLDESEVVGYLQKPVNTEDIEAVLKALEKLSDDMNNIGSIRSNYVSGDFPKEKRGSLSGKKVLVVDDDIKNIFVLSSVLENEGALVMDALNGKKALQILEKEEVDLILMDIMMPQMNGYEAIKHIRSNKKTESIPIIALTAKAMKDDKEKSIEAGADDYMTKPAEYETIIYLAKAWIDKKR